VNGAGAARWRSWWSDVSTVWRAGTLLVVLFYWLTLAGLGGLRGDHLAVGLLALALSYGGPRAAEALRFAVPLVLTGVVYDSRQFLPDSWRGAVHVAGPYLLEKRLFGIATQAGVVTPCEWWQRHTHPVLDLVTGACYITFIASFVAAAAYFEFSAGRSGTATRTAAYVRERAPRVMWALFFMNLAAFATAQLHPVAPPWYVDRNGLGPPQVLAHGNAAGAARFDALVGVPVFAAFYSRSVDPFGAIPSLHVAYPLLAAYFAFRFGAARAATLAVALLMCFSAVYLNHHYVIDLLAGGAYALATGIAVDVVHDAMLSRGRRSAAG
jgi:membrane-associated phospholipid phosphatase